MISHICGISKQNKMNKHSKTETVTEVETKWWSEGGAGNEEIDKGDQEVQTSSYKINQPQG